MQLPKFKHCGFLMIFILSLSEQYVLVSGNECSTAVARSICLDCFNILLCGDSEDIPPLLIECQEGKVCYQRYEGDSFAFCSDPSSVPECTCPNEIPAIIPDHYDNEKFIVCLSDGPHIETCENGEFNPETLICDDSDLPGGECNMTGTNPINCTHYFVCDLNDEPVVIGCPEGAVFNPNSGRCELYQPFNCSKYSTDGLYPDSLNCSVFHFCSDGEEIGEPLICPNGNVYDPDSEACVEDNGVVTCPSGCVPDVMPDFVCEDSETSYKLDCKRYAQCREISPGVYEPVIEVCLGNLVYSAILQGCTFPIFAPECSN